MTCDRLSSGMASTGHILGPVDQALSIINITPRYTIITKILSEQKSSFCNIRGEQWNSALSSDVAKIELKIGRGAAGREFKWKDTMA